jgi:hypothetical protein
VREVRVDGTVEDERSHLRKSHRACRDRSRTSTRRR